MKKIIYLIAIIAFVFTSCNPLEDINAEIDAITTAETINDGVVEDLVITLTEDDYTEIGLSNFYFTTEEEAKTKLPDFLATTYPSLGVDFNANGEILAASSAVVTYNLFDPVSTIVKKEYTLTSSDYTNLGLTALNSSDDINQFFNANFPNEVKGTIYDLTYLTNPDITDYALTDDDYDLVGNGRFDNFDIRAGRAEETEEARRLKIQTILLNNFPNANIGDKYRVAYKAFNGSATVDLEMLVILNDNAPDPNKTTDYTLTNADFALVGNDRFNNFDIRQGRAEETLEARRAKIETILLNNFPSAVDGDIYRVTYAVWEGFDSTRTTLVVKNGSGYDLFSALTYDFYTFTLETVTNRFAFTDSWNPPTTFTADDYTAMGQRFPNFSGSTDEAVRRIAIYLKMQMPFAAAGDFLAVQYDFFSGGSVTARNVNLMYDGNQWNMIPETSEIQLQFGHDGTKWVPDNTIKYTLTQDDYELVGNGRFGNFDVRSGRDEETVESRRVKISQILLNNFPQYGLGQKFSVSYNVWEPGDAVYIMNVIHDGTEYVLQ